MADAFPYRDQFFDAWRSASMHTAASIREASRATWAALGVPNADAPAGPELAYSRPNWSYERTVDAKDHITVGDRVVFRKPVSTADVRAFATASGDTNRLHLDPPFARETRFGRVVIHGGLLAGLVSAALARLPGLVIYLSQELNFVAPATVDRIYVTTVEVIESLGDSRYRLETTVEAEAEEDGVVLEGDAVVLVDPLPDGETGAAEP